MNVNSDLMHGMLKTDVVAAQLLMILYIMILLALSDICFTCLWMLQMHVLLWLNCSLFALPASVNMLMYAMFEHDCIMLLLCVDGCIVFLLLYTDYFDLLVSC